MSVYRQRVHWLSEVSARSTHTAAANTKDLCGERCVRNIYIYSRMCVIALTLQICLRSRCYSPVKVTHMFKVGKPVHQIQ